MTVYNLEVEDDHSYVANGFVVHNCAACIALHGTFHPLSERMRNHTNCRCVQVPGIKGQPPPFQKGTEWFEKQPAETQKAIFGNSKSYKDYKSGRLKLEDFVGRKDDPQWGSSYYALSHKRALAGEGRFPGDAPKLGLPDLLSPTPQVVRRPQPKPLSRKELDEYSNSQHWKAWRDSLTQAEKASLKAYSDWDYTEINSYLRGTNKDPLRESINRISAIDSALLKGRVDRDLLAFRGLVSSKVYQGFASGKLRVGDEFVEAGFLSTSLDFQAAKEFADRVTEDRVILRVNVPAGSRGALLSDREVSLISDEAELLLPRGSRLRIDQIRKGRGLVFVNVTLVGI